MNKVRNTTKRRVFRNKCRADRLSTKAKSTNAKLFPVFHTKPSTLKYNNKMMDSQN